MIQELWLRPDIARPSVPTAPAADPRWYHRRLPGYAATPLYDLPELANEMGVGRLWVKHESTRFGLPSFKALGASWAAYRLVEQRVGRSLRDEWSTVEDLRALLSNHADLTLVTATDGNHGRAVARVAALFGMSAHIYVPEGTAAARIQAIRAEGARVDQTDVNYDETVRIAAATASGDRLIVSDTSWPGYEEVPGWISDGYSTMFREIQAALTESGSSFPDFVVVPVGVGALAAAAVRHFAHGPTRVIAVEPVGAECVTRSLRVAERTTVPGPQVSEMVGLNCGTPSFTTWPLLKAGLSASLVIDDSPMHDAMRRLARHGIAAGETGAAALGGLIASDHDVRELLGVSAKSSVLLLCTEGVTDPANYLAVVGTTKTKGTDMVVDIEHWQRRLRDLTEEYAVPGASFAALVDGTVHTAASGVLNVKTGVETTVDSVFQIGSISKIYTATMVLQLVDEGLLDLDAPILRYVPELQLSSPGLVDGVTVRHLLTHTSGIDGDYFFDGGRGDDSLKRFVASCLMIGLTHPVGATMSYCNAGFSLLGAIVERATFTTWDTALRNRIIDRLGLDSTATLAEDVMRFRVAHGHGLTDGKPVLAPTWALARSVGPAGGICATASDVVAFARTHLPGCDAILPETRAAQMLEPQTRIANGTGLDQRSIGLGWAISEWGGRLVHGHDGGTIGQKSFLRIVPDAGVVVCLLTNGGRTEELYRRFLGEFLADVCDLSIPPAVEPPATPVTVDEQVHVGVYERWGERLELTATEDGLRAKVTITTALSETLPDEVVEAVLVPVRENVFLTRVDDSGPWTALTFYTLADGSRYVHVDGRAARKIS
ncbi:diaminopropionate ammonia-lyase [Actinocrispum wychmicini]|uniref:diaminopropionate ammonia-lyase n=1 Tax=Actinocrispum wychmicini TaxID=1213861 RepID=UPI00140555FD|nr:diaminopropionate ammonia-lyase [Actinocrispum wychmicini]